MKIKKSLTITIAMLLLSGCASYQASSLSSMASEVVLKKQSISTLDHNDIIVCAKAFDPADCMKYLDRDVISQGFQPIQIYIQNNSNKDYSFSLGQITLPVASSESVAEKVHTNTVGRVVGYSVGALFLWPLVIPAVVDGLKASEANEKLDKDFAAKTARDQIIYGKSHFNKVIFVPVKDYQDRFSITLINQEDYKPEVLDVRVS
jgi:hypothetical protein